MPLFLFDLNESDFNDAMETDKFVGYQLTSITLRLHNDVHVTFLTTSKLPVLKQCNKHAALVYLRRLCVVFSKTTSNSPCCGGGSCATGSPAVTAVGLSSVRHRIGICRFRDGLVTVTTTGAGSSVSSVSVPVTTRRRRLSRRRSSHTHT